MGLLLTAGCLGTTRHCMSGRKNVVKLGGRQLEIEINGSELCSHRDQ